MKILVACPTYAGHEFCRDAFLAAYERLDWPEKDLLMVDTTNFSGSGYQKIAQGMEEIRLRFLAGAWKRWFSVESDVIVPQHALRTLVELDPTGIFDWAVHAYPDRERGDSWQSGFGCALISRRFCEVLNFQDFPPYSAPDGHIWRLMKPFVKKRTLAVVEYFGLLEIQHLAK